MSAMIFSARTPRPGSAGSGRAYRCPPRWSGFVLSLAAIASSTVTRDMGTPAEKHGESGNFSARHASPPAGAWPAVSVVMSVLNEERHLDEAVTAILEQDYPGELEIVIALGPSRDRTDEIADKLAVAHPNVCTVPNPSGRTPSGLNRAVKQARHPVIARVDGHSLLPAGYVKTAVSLLESVGADN